MTFPEAGGAAGAGGAVGAAGIAAPGDVATPGDDRRAQLERDFRARRGYWSPWLDALLRRSPDFFEAFLGFTGTPWATGPLPPRVKELVYVAIDGAITHLYEPGIRKHLGEAIRHGATAAECVEALQIASHIGLATLNVAAPLLREALADAGRTDRDAPLSAASASRREAFERETGHWDDGLQAMLEIDPGAFDAYASSLAAAWRTRALDPVTRELLCIAVYASTTFLHAPGIRLHMRRALACGATDAQITEVLQLTSVLGIHTCTVGLPILDELARAADSDPSTGGAISTS